MKKTCEVMASTPLFAGLDHELYLEYCRDTHIHLHAKGQPVIMEGADCHGIGVIIEGQAARQKFTPTGEYTTLNLLGPGTVFGADLIFSSHRLYPYSLEALTLVKTILISREDLLGLIARSSQLLLNYMAFLSDRGREQDQRIHLLSQKTLRLKIAGYLLSLLEEQLEYEGKTLREILEFPTTRAVTLPVSKEVVARLLAMPRPSFSRELISMEKDGLILVKGRHIWLTDLPGLACGLYEDCDPDL
ncbi:MAG TPA: Crp/Fnr family transcriptional regulator [Bacillota bacterium]|jgi:CRP-like cAMP-binding protein|nr:Crp/Fnr family transcriptional regulator [Fastidiosipila sp.]HPX93307.1 Crp/Fnr family transcriptional regulator [Bacillota bacterium]HQB80966.1 Crp/Fnr family transcriptional regulator [Bacillota bacterium]